MRLSSSLLGALLSIPLVAAACSSSSSSNDATPGAGANAGSTATQSCEKNADCASKVCNANAHVCVAATAADGAQNGDETDVDCGGSAPRCADLARCKVATDCTSAVCTDRGAGLACQPPSSTDGVKNGAETGVDCGGSGNPKCANGQACNAREDCTEDVCIGNACTAPSDADGLKDGTETDIDCGGPTAKRCADNATCNVGDDCVSKHCDTGATGRCLAPTFADTIQNGTETDVDCGGTAGHECAAGKSCLVGTDCSSSGCNDQKRCAVARSCTNPGGYGARTCGLGGGGGVGAADWEDCCIGIAMTTADGGKVKLDKYQVTAGRYRVFLESVNYNVRGFVQTARAAGKIPAAPGNGTKSVLDAAWDPYLPTSFDGSAAAGEINDCDQGGLDPQYGKCCEFYATPAGGCGALTNNGGNCHYWNPSNSTCTAGHDTTRAGVYTSVYNQLGGTIFRGNSQSQTGCFVGAPGTHTFRFPDDKQDGADPDQPQSVYDTKSMSCANYLMAQAFCVWDGGRLETASEWLAAYGSGQYPWTTAAETRAPLGAIGTNSYYGCRWPWATDASHPDCAINWDTTKTSIELMNFNYTYEYPKLQNDDFVVFINTPGRIRGRGPLGHADVVGNLFELTSTLELPATPTPFNTVVHWSGSGSWEGHGISKNINPNPTNSGDYRYAMISKYGKTGLRCAKPNN